jgi:hypothetical protein
MKEIEPVHSTWLCSSPIPSTLMRIVSPGLRCRGGLKPDPTPAGVPVAKMSPAWRVIPADIVAIISVIENIIRDVRAS